MYDYEIPFRDTQKVAKLSKSLATARAAIDGQDGVLSGCSKLHASVVDDARDCDCDVTNTVRFLQTQIRHYQRSLVFMAQKSSNISSMVGNATLTVFIELTHQAVRNNQRKGGPYRTGHPCRDPSKHTFTPDGLRPNIQRDGASSSRSTRGTSRFHNYQRPHPDCNTVPTSFTCSSESLRSAQKILTLTVSITVDFQLRNDIQHDSTLNVSFKLVLCRNTASCPDDFARHRFPGKPASKSLG